MATDFFPGQLSPVCVLLEAATDLVVCGPLLPVAFFVMSPQNRSRLWVPGAFVPVVSECLVCFCAGVPTAMDRGVYNNLPTEFPLGEQDFYTFS